MMLHFFSSTPRLGLEITSSTIRLAIVSGSGADLCILHTGAVDLPAGLVTESYSSANIQDFNEMVNVLRQCLAAAPAQTDRAALSLPDGVFRVQTLEFDELPSKSIDRERLIRWRLEKAAAFDVSATVLRYQVLRQGERGFTVLACLVKQSVLEQYESVLTQLGLEPWLVGLSSFHILNFFSPIITKKPSASALAHLTDDSFTTIVTEAGGARFYRFKELKRGGGEINVKLLREIEDSLHFYTHMDRSQTSEVKRLFLAGETAATYDLADQLHTATSLDVEILSPAAVLAAPDRESSPTAFSISMAAALGAGSAL